MEVHAHTHTVRKIWIHYLGSFYCYSLLCSAVSWWRSSEKHERTTKVFAKAGLDNVTSAICRHQQRFGLDVQYLGLVHNFNNIFSLGHLYRAGQTMNSLPSQILER
jgi:hypothetical protein